MSKPQNRRIKLGAKEGRRFKALGDIGEQIAQVVLAQNGFEDIVDLNQVQTNFPFADFSATRNGVRCLISVKARNKYQADGKINPAYKLGKKVYEHIDALQQDARYQHCTPAWLAIALDEKSYDAYFGTIEELNGMRAIRMSREAVASHETLAVAAPHAYDYDSFVNKYDNVA